VEVSVQLLPGPQSASASALRRAYDPPEAIEGGVLAMSGEATPWIGR
jgi:hypothetical protein